jgi:acetyl esterase/lipase
MQRWLVAPLCVAAASCAEAPRTTLDRPSTTDLGPRLDAELRGAFVELPIVEVGLNTIQDERRQLETYLAEQRQSPRAVDRRIDGATTLRVRVYDPPATDQPLAALLWFHGGGWTLGRPEMDEVFLQELADAVPLRVFSVDYRLAPEHPFPAAHDDARAALRWLSDHVSELRVDPGRILIGGSSSGANLAAGLALRDRDEHGGRARIAFQLLLYPVLDDRLSSASMAELADPRTITRAFMQSHWQAYIGGQGEPSAYASPARAQDVLGLPDTALIVAELDPLRDEATTFAARLWQSGVGCDLHVFRGTIHGFDVIAPDSSIARLARNVVVTSLQREATR